MLRTNSKKARINTDDYIMTIAEGIEENSKYYLCFDYDTKNIDDVCKCIWYQYFIPEYVQYNKQFEAGRISLFELFEDWARGLPCEGLFDYYNYYNPDPVEIVGDILEETPEERAKFSQDQAADRLTMMIYNRIIKRVNWQETIRKYSKWY